MDELGKEKRRLHIPPPKSMTNRRKILIALQLLHVATSQIDAIGTKPGTARSCDKLNPAPSGRAGRIEEVEIAIIQCFTSGDTKAPNPDSQIEIERACRTGPEVVRYLWREGGVKL